MDDQGNDDRYDEDEVGAYDLEREGKEAPGRLVRAIGIRGHRCRRWFFLIVFSRGFY